ncbi:DUF2283 domain-containing protein [Corynebacterium tapiri]|uniref:DUF2283 domain-containing protein n=1 Tax=Corynebacterium tapiri TaxID=1448266 RepID=A0A5C4U252_9CORY|nr:DUF2283 domain-containing protein [Corynebacterium tapiri]TNL95751.1 DUF2283 domain-containing protein [Corynebacterium tapiri]
MKLTYDPEVDAAYLDIAEPGRLSERQISGITAEGLEGELEIDIDKDGRVIGIEFLAASEVLPPEVLDRADRLH